MGRKTVFSKGGNAHQRAIAKAHQTHAQEAVLPAQPLSDPHGIPEPLNFWPRFKSKRSDIFALTGLLAAFGSWGYTALNPQPSIAFGLVLIGLAGLCVAGIVIHILGCRWIGSILVV